MKCSCAVIRSRFTRAVRNASHPLLTLAITICFLTVPGAAGANPPVTVIRGSEPLADVSGASSFVLTTISAGETHACGLTPQGEAYCWGNNFYGKLGNGDGLYTPSPIPVKVAAADTDGDGLRDTELRFSAISAGVSHTCALTAATGDAYCWGDNQQAQLGNGFDTGGRRFVRREGAPMLFQA
jgi:Regulator of chromosome condensation (RCC1) repeat